MKNLILVTVLLISQQAIFAQKNMPKKLKKLAKKLVTQIEANMEFNNDTRPILIGVAPIVNINERASVNSDGASNNFKQDLNIKNENFRRDLLKSIIRLNKKRKIYERRITIINRERTEEILKELHYSRKKGFEQFDNNMLSTLN